MSPTPADAAEQLAAAGRIAEAVLLLNRLASAGEPHGLFSLAMWRLGRQGEPLQILRDRPGQQY